MPHIKMTRSIQFRGRPLDEGQKYEVTAEEHKELGVYGSHVNIAPPAPEVPAAEPTPESAPESAAEDPVRETADAAPETETAQAPATPARKRRA